MPTIAAIHAFEDAFADAIVAAFNADSVLGNIAYGPRVVTGLPTSRIDVHAAGFGKASEQQVYAISRWWDQHYSGPVSLAIITQRAAGADASTHSTRVGRVRYLLSPKAQILTSANLPSYEVLSVENTSTRYSFDTGTNTDRTDLTFDIHFGLLAAALAAAT